MTPNLKDNGYEIVKGVLDEEEIKNMRSGVWDYLEHITQKFPTPISRKDHDTWKYISELYPLHSMLIQHWGIGHAQYIWDVRQNPKVKDVFAKIWKTDDLVTSFDGGSIHMPPEVTGRGWYKGNDWFHCDQSFCRNDFECVQSWVTAYDVNDGDATLSVLSDSHKYHAEFAEEFSGYSKSDWYKLTSEQIDWFKDKGCKQVRVECKAGDMVLWDSRTIHCGSEPLPERKNYNFRFVSYVCMLPRSTVPKNIKKKRQKAFDELRTTSHWPNKSKLFPKTPRTWGNDLKEIVSIDPPSLTGAGKSLI